MNTIEVLVDNVFDMMSIRSNDIVDLRLEDRIIRDGRGRIIWLKRARLNHL